MTAAFAVSPTTLAQASLSSPFACDADDESVCNSICSCSTAEADNRSKPKLHLLTMEDRESVNNHSESEIRPLSVRLGAFLSAVSLVDSYFPRRMASHISMVHMESSTVLHQNSSRGEEDPVYPLGAYLLAQYSGEENIISMIVAWAGPILQNYPRLSRHLLSFFVLVDMRRIDVSELLFLLGEIYALDGETRPSIVNSAFRAAAISNDDVIPPQQNVPTGRASLPGVLAGNDYDGSDDSSQSTSSGGHRRVVFFGGIIDEDEQLARDENDLAEHQAAGDRSTEGSDLRGENLSDGSLGLSFTTSERNEPRS